MSSGSGIPAAAARLVEWADRSYLLQHRVGRSMLGAEQHLRAQAPGVEPRCPRADEPGSAGGGALAPSDSSEAGSYEDRRPAGTADPTRKDLPHDPRTSVTGDPYAMITPSEVSVAPAAEPQRASLEAQVAKIAQAEAIKDRLVAFDEQIAAEPDCWKRQALQDQRDDLVDQLKELVADLPNDAADGGCADGTQEDFDEAQTMRYVGEGPLGLRPAVVTNRELVRVYDAGIEALAIANTPATIFRRAGKLRWLKVDDHGVERLESLDPANLAVVLSRMISWEQVKPALKRNGSGMLRVSTDPPAKLVSAWWESPPAVVPPVVRVTEAPYIAADGLIVTTKGYRDGVLLLADFSCLSVPQVPTDEDVAAARVLLDTLIEDFPFSTPADRAHYITLLAESVAWRWINEAMPLHWLEGSDTGSGKTTSGDVFSILATGRETEWTTLAEAKEEQEKTVTSRLMQGPPYLGLDNVKTAVDLAVLEAALTGSFAARRFGTQELSAAMSTVGITLMVTTNNGSPSDDLIRRLVRTRLVPNVEDTGSRTYKKDIIPWTKQHRVELLRALLILCRRAWLNLIANKPTGAGRRLASFSMWSRVMDEVLVVAGYPGFLDDAEARQALRPQGSEEWPTVLAAWWSALGHRHLSASELLDLLVAPPEKHVSSDGTVYATPAKQVSHLAGALGDAQNRQQRLGNLLRKRVDKVTAGFAIRLQVDTNKKINRYYLEPVGSQPPAPAAGPQVAQIPQVEQGDVLSAGEAKSEAADFS